MTGTRTPIEQAEQARHGNGHGRRARTVAASAASCLAGIAVVWAGAAAGLWFLPFATAVLVAAAAGVAGLRAATTFAAACLIALGGWGFPLAWMSMSGEPVGATALVVASLAGLPAYPATVIALTLMIAVLQALAGAWLGRQVAGLVAS